MELHEMFKKVRKDLDKKAKDKSDQLLNKKSRQRTATVTELRRRKPIDRGTYEAARIKVTFFIHICVNCGSRQKVLAKTELVKVNTHDPMKCEIELINSHGTFSFYSELPLHVWEHERYMPACEKCIDAEMEKRNG